MTQAGWALVCYDVIAVVMVLWLWVHGYVVWIWDCGHAERRDETLWWAQREGDDGGVGLEALVRDGLVENEMRRLGLV
jgi:hypothetical protein